MTQENDKNPQCSPLPWTTNRQLGSLMSSGRIVCYMAVNNLEHEENSEDSYNARLIVASCNAIHQAAQRYGINPIVLAENLASGLLIEIMEFVTCISTKEKSGEDITKLGHPFAILDEDSTIDNARDLVAKVKGNAL